MKPIQMKKDLMSELNQASITGRSVFKAAGQLVSRLVLAGAFLFLAQVSHASPVVNSFSYAFRAAMTNDGADPDASGAVSGSLRRQGVTDSQRLTITVSKLDTNATYQVVAFMDDSVTPTSVTNFTTDRRGRSSLVYLKSSHPGGNPLPAAI